MKSALETSRARPRSLELLLNLLLAGLSIAAVLGLFEIGLRLAGYRALYEMYSKPSIFWEHDPLLGWSHQPRAQGDYIGPRPWPVEFQEHVAINSLGLRGPELEPLPPGGHRILALGDSMVAAFEVPWEATFEALLQDQLSASTGTPVQVINAGVRGYGTDQSLLYYRQRGRQLHPDLVIFFLSGNDVVDNTTLHEMRRPFGKPAFTLGQDGSLELVGSPVPRYPACSEYRLTTDAGVARIDKPLWRVLCSAQMSLFDHSALFSFVTLLVPWKTTLLSWLYYLGNPHLEFDPDGPGTDASDGLANRLTQALVLQMKREVERDGAQFVVIGEQGQLNRLGRQRLEAAGVEVVSLEAIEGASQQEIRFRHDSHYNVTGHARLAKLLAPLIQSRLEAATAAGRTGVSAVKSEW